MPSVNIFMVAMRRCCLIAIAMGAILAQAFAQVDPLPSWNDGPAKQAILDFVARTTKAGNADCVQPSERIATFDNDGTLWVEKPM